jgi:AraC family transcriptional regulator, regulatory protein of adaptative response / methylated-DNA-[protein]-cysteine methyltransferase
MMKTSEVSSGIEEASNNPEILGLEADRWKAVVARDASKDSTFVFGVRSTGIYCKPSCPSRHPRIEQVVLFKGPDEAELSGYRACKRCHPREQGNSPRSEVVERICRYIDGHFDEKLTLTRLSREAGLSPFHFQRTFKRVLGISPRQYIEARRLEKVKESLRRGETVTDSLYGAGFKGQALREIIKPTRSQPWHVSSRRGRVVNTLHDC